MEEFLVLGIVPNTNIQISFVGWLLAVQLLLLIALLVKHIATKYSAMHAALLNRKALHLLTVHHLM